MITLDLGTAKFSCEQLFDSAPPLDNVDTVLDRF